WRHSRPGSRSFTSPGWTARDHPTSEKWLLQATLWWQMFQWFVASVFHLTDDSQVAANQPGCGHEARRYLHLREPGEPGAAQSDHCGSHEQDQDGLARADRACNG